ncbi:tetratricopeptide repeat protein [Calothrix sp. CCY 0018]|uniref:tetratricopeptide repeat protein n=1 Tax=Calothrix sp. CCY 0018 TaxID=3103864 RepID=UPI0039C6B2E4
MNNNEENENREINTGDGNYNERIQGDYIQQQGNFGVGVNKGTIINNPPSKESFKPIKYIPKFGSDNFVGRKDELIKIHDKFSETNNKVAISSVSGMGGVGKTELATQYARRYEDDYPGGICWLNVRDTNLAAEIIQFVQLKMGLKIPQKDIQENPLTLEEQVAWCWQNWQPPEGLVLVILDDVTNLEGFADLLPSFERFRVLVTTRLRDIDTNIEEISLDVLSPEEALELFKKLIGERKVNKEFYSAQELCKWLGYLPLGIELVGRYIKKKPPHFTLKKMLEQLQEQRLHQDAMNPQQKGLRTAQLGVLDAFELSWKELNPTTREFAALLSLFAANIFEWEWVESMSKSLNWDESDVGVAIEEVYQRNLVQSLEYEDASYYQIHPLIREFLQTKLKASAQINEFKQVFTSTFIQIAQTILETTTLEDIKSVTNAIPHLTEVAENHLDALSDENLIWVFIGLARFYEGQGLYALAEPWKLQCLSTVRERLGENHPHVAASLNNLAALYHSQGRYEAAEPLYIQALELSKQLQGVNHPDVAASLNNLALLYKSQGRYEAAEPLYIQALELSKQLQGVNHPDVAMSLNNLALLYDSQGRYEAAEPLYIQALELSKQLLGENHPHVAMSLNNLAELYYSQGRYEAAEPLYIQALEILERVLDANHPHLVKCRGNLEDLRVKQGTVDS